LGTYRGRRRLTGQKKAFRKNREPGEISNCPDRQVPITMTKLSTLLLPLLVLASLATVITGCGASTNNGNLHERNVVNVRMDRECGRCR
jgi:hypothetical protein